jgi:hypothetical protein
MVKGNASSATQIVASRDQEFTASQLLETSNGSGSRDDDRQSWK